MGYGGGLLHSHHSDIIPRARTQQQITCYHHKDANNDWFFYPNRHEPVDYRTPTLLLRYVGNGDVIRLIHAQTGRNLHSHSSRRSRHQGRLRSFLLRQHHRRRHQGPLGHVEVVNDASSSAITPRSAL